jgi:hypothetical protein
VKRPNFYNSEATAFDYLQARAPAALWKAVLDQAMRDAVDGPSQSECRHMTLNEAAEYRAAVMVAAEEWLADTLNEPRRFEWVCEQLSLEPSAVRREIERRKSDRRKQT